MFWPTSWQAVSPRLLSALKLRRFSSVFPSHPPTAPSVLLPCPLLQGSCYSLAPTAEPSPSPCPPGSARGGRHLFSCPCGLIPIHFVHIHEDTKDSLGSLGSFSCTPWTTLAKSCSGLPPPGPGVLRFFISSFITRVEITASWGLDSQGFSIGCSGQPFKSRTVLKMHKT